MDLNWGGAKTVDEVMEEPELASQIPPSLLPAGREATTSEPPAR